MLQSDFDDEIFSFSESDIETLATPKVMARGRVLFDEGALEEFTRRGAEISALCGGEDEAYILNARFGASGLDATGCSCPYDYEGICKHRVALLLTWAHMPEAFEFLGAVTAKKTPGENSDSALLRALKSRERDELALLIAQLVETEPKLKGVVRRLLQPRLSEGEINKVRRSVESIFKKVMRSEQVNFASIRRDLKFHTRAASSLEAARATDAGRLFAAILEGMMSAGEEPFAWDEGGVLLGASDECSDALARLAKLKSTPAAHRAQWLETLARAFLFDLKLGGYGFAEQAAAVLHTASEDEWPALETILDAALVLHPAGSKLAARMISLPMGAVSSGYNFNRDWMRAQIVQLKAARLQQSADPLAARRLLLESGTPPQQVTAHLENRDYEAAFAVADAHFGRFDGLLHQFADELNAADQWPLARAFATRHKMQEWLAHAAAARGESDALELNLALFKSSQRLETWDAIMRLAPDSQRDTVRSELRQWLKKQKQNAILFDIALHENDGAPALELWDALNPLEKLLRREALANAVEKSHPNEAFLLWDEIAHALISKRTRDAYCTAAKALKRAQRVLIEAGRRDEWETYVLSLRAQYASLRALQEELNRAQIG